MKTYLILLISVLTISACTFDNKAIRGGSIVDKYNIGEINLPIEEVHYKNLDGSILSAWFIKKANHDRLPTIIFLHGSRGNVLDYLPVIRNLHQNIDANIFACDLLKNLGFEERIRGSHHIFRKEGVIEKINLQRDKDKAKPYQVKQVRNVILKYKLGGKINVQI